MVNASTWQALLRREALAEQKGRCHYCKSPLRARLATADHKHPRCRGGLTTRANIAAACDGCNQAKGNKSEGQFFNLIKGREPPEGVHIEIIMIWATRCIFTRAERACRRIERAAA